MHLSSRFDPLIQQPERLTVIESWHRHIPFSFCLLDMLKPAVLVELGTHRGDSYSAFCQGVTAQQLPTRCYAVDTWQGDSQAGHYDDSVYQDLCQWHEPRFAHFSSLLRMTFDQALEHFADGTVDLLHIDGLHTYEAVKHDFESWLPKLSERAVVLFHDTNVHYGDFAVWQLWGELQERYPSFEFPFGFGLGVLAVGSQVPEAVLEFLQHARSQPAEVTEYFYRQGDAAALRKAQGEITRLSEHLASVGEQLQQSRDVVEQRDGSIQSLQTEQAGLISRQAQTEQQAAEQVAALELRRDELKQRLLQTLRRGQQLRTQAQALDQQLGMLLQGRSWRLRNALMRLIGLGNRQLHYQPLQLEPISGQDQQLLAGQRPDVTIVIPVYGGVEDTIACIEAVLAARYALTAEVVVINDASPEPELVDWLENNAERFTLLHNQSNLGFVGTVNRGMALYPERDVVLVNSDTLVANDWLDRLQQAAYSAPDVASVTPLSNNATICSYPLFCQDNPLPPGLDVAALDRLCARANTGQTVDIPTAVGFCMYIRRDCLDQAGLFDADLFGRGYGEENEFCLRTAQMGWRHLLTGDTFVYHKGGVSFAETQSENQRHGHRVLTGLYPDYDWLIQQHIAQDPAVRLRFAVDAAQAGTSGLPVVLMVHHARGGGSGRHLDELAGQLAGQAMVFALQPASDGVLCLRSFSGGRPANALYFTPGRDDAALLATLQALGVSRLHYHHLLDLPESVLQLPQQLGCPFDVTVHDFYLACPQVTLVDEQGDYCGAPVAAGCNECLRKRPVAGVDSIEQWHVRHAPLLGGAERVFMPSGDTLRRMRGYFPQVKTWVLAEHEEVALEAVEAPAIQGDEPLRVLVLGALSAFKGADSLEAVALQARMSRLPVEFHLLGYAYRPLKEQPFSALQVHGAYQEAELASLIADIDPHVVWFPGNCPETWSYTLSAALAAGLPVLAPAIGAFPERLASRPWSWLQPVNATQQESLDALLQVRQALLNGEAPVVPEGTLEQAGFVYQRDYVDATLVAAAERVQTATQGQVDPVANWPLLHGQWQVLQTAPAPELLLQVSNPRVRRILVTALKKGWLQPLLGYIPAGLQARLKRLVTR